MTAITDIPLDTDSYPYTITLDAPTETVVTIPPAEVDGQ